MTGECTFPAVLYGLYHEKSQMVNAVIVWLRAAFMDHWLNDMPNEQRIMES